MGLTGNGVSYQTGRGSISLIYKMILKILRDKKSKLKDLIQTTVKEGFK